MNTTQPIYLIQAITFHGGRISRVMRESVGRSMYGSEMAAAAFKQDLELL